MMMKMDGALLLSQIERMERAAIGYYTGQIAAEQATAMRYYLGKPFGTEEEGRSQVISSDVWDGVEGMTPMVLRPFVSAENVVKFNPVGPDDEEAAKQESEYINWIVTQRNDVFNELVAWVKTGLLQKNGVVKYWWEKSRASTIERYFGVEDDVYTALIEAEDVTVIEHSEEVNDQGAPIHDVTLRVAEDIGEAKYCVIPPEEFLISRDARSPNPQLARFVQHRRKVTISELRAMGYEVEDDISDFGGHNSELSPQYQARRNEEESNWSAQSELLDPASREVMYRETYLMVDYDGDGIAELRKVCAVGSTTLMNEETEEIPFCGWTPYTQPFKFYGRCPADELTEIQLIKSTVLRQTMDNIYTVNNNTRYVSGKVNLDDLIDNQIAGIVRVDGDVVSNHVMPAPVTPIGQITMPMIEYFDSAKENRIGFTRYNQGGDGSDLNKTATGIRLIQQAGDVRNELISRSFAEQGLAPLMRGIHGLCRRHATKAETIRLRGEWVTVDPRGWKTRKDLTVSVGLGNADKQLQMQGIQLLMGEQKQLMQAGIVTPENLYNAAAKLVAVVGHKNPEQFFTSPDKMPKPEPPDPMQDPSVMFQVADLKLKSRELDIKEQQGQPTPQVAPAEPPDETPKLMFEADQRERDRTVQIELARMTDDRERFKAELTAKVDLDVASAANQVKLEIAGQGREDAAMQHSEKTEPVNATMQALTDALTAAVASMNLPRKWVRGIDGRVARIEVDKSGPDGRVAGIE